MQKALRTLCELLDSGREEEYSESWFCLDEERVTRDILEISEFSKKERANKSLFALLAFRDRKMCLIM